GGIFAQPRPTAVGTVRLAAVARKHHAVLNFVGLLFQIFEKCVETSEIAISGPEQFFLFGRQIGVGPMDRKIKLQRILDQNLQPLAHFLTPPWCDGTIVHRTALVGDDKVGIYTDDLAIAFTAAAGPVGIVKTKKIGGWLLESHPVELKLVREMLSVAMDFEIQLALTFKKSGLNGVR